MNESDDARLAKAAMKSLLVPAPESLKAELKRRARNWKPVPSIWDGLREALSRGAWAYGAGAAFAAALIGVFILRSVPHKDTTTIAPQVLQDLWSDDDGEDNDEI